MAITRGVGPTYVHLSSETSDIGVITGTTAGRSLVAVVYWYDPGQTITPVVSVAGESNMTAIAGSKFVNAIGNEISGQIYYGTTTGGDKTITVNLGTSGYAEVGVMEYAGMETASPVDNSTSAIGTTTITGNLTTTTANALIVAGGLNNTEVATAGSLYTLFGGSGFTTGIIGFPGAEDDVDAGGAGSKTVDFGAVVANFGLTVAAFKIAGGAGTTPKTFTATDSLAGGELL